MSPRAVVFAYHDVGDRCLRALVSEGWDVPLLVTHEADPTEKAWFADVGATAVEYGIPVLRPANVAQAGIERTLSQLRPDFIFSFYYRSLIGEGVLGCARRAALNMHGSLLPKYRGRAPVNWAILNGERETGATLHHMVSKADAGDIVDQQAVPILCDDTARDVMDKVTVAAEIVLARSLPLLAAGRAARTPQRPSDQLRKAHARRWAHRLELAGGAHSQPRARGRATVSRSVRGCSGGSAGSSSAPVSLLEKRRKIARRISSKQVATAISPAAMAPCSSCWRRVSPVLRSTWIVWRRISRSSASRDTCRHDRHALHRTQGRRRYRSRYRRGACRASPRRRRAGHVGGWSPRG